MDYRNHIEKVIDYIEENMCGEINLADCARVSGYSPGYFPRIFRNKYNSGGKEVCDYGVSSWY